MSEPKNPLRRLLGRKGERVRDKAPLPSPFEPRPGSGERQGWQGLLDALALATAPVPGVGDAAGLAADGYRYATDPESRTLGNVALTGLGALPFVPSFAGMARKVHDVPYPSWYNRPFRGDEDMLDSFEVHEQPTAKDIAKQIKGGSGTLRAVRDTRTGDIYTWDAETALHEEAIRHLGLGDHAENLGQIHSVDDFKRLKTRGQR